VIWCREQQSSPLLSDSFSFYLLPLVVRCREQQPAAAQARGEGGGEEEQFSSSALTDTLAIQVSMQRGWGERGRGGGGRGEGRGGGRGGRGEGGEGEGRGGGRGEGRGGGGGAVLILRTHRHPGHPGERAPRMGGEGAGGEGRGEGGRGGGEQFLSSALTDTLAIQVSMRRRGGERGRGGAALALCTHRHLPGGSVVLAWLAAKSHAPSCSPLILSPFLSKPNGLLSSLCAPLLYLSPAPSGARRSLSARAILRLLCSKSLRAPQYSSTIIL